MRIVPTAFTHAAVGLGLASAAPFRRRPALFWAASAALPVVPDLDVLVMALGVPYSSVWSHRGLSHSLAAAAVLGAISAAALADRMDGRDWAVAAYFTLVTASHGILDAFTDGGLGVAFFAPLDTTRYFFPWRPVAVSPLGLDFFSEWGLRVLVSELVWIWLPTAVVVGTIRIARARHTASTRSP